MQHIIKYTCRSVWITILLMSSTFLQAQNEPYRGGFGGGDLAVRTTQTVCNNFRFFGGFGRGDSSAFSTVLNNAPFRYYGGFGRGDSSAFSAVLNNAPFRYYGGFGRGDSSAFSTVLNNAPFRYFGGFGRGDSSSRTNLVNCNNFRFWGDSADGYSSAQFVKIRNYFGNDTSIVLICAADNYNLLQLYNVEGLTNVWDIATPATAGLGTYKVIGTTQSGCKDTAIALLKQEIAKWTGIASNNWHNPANWSNGKVPDEITHVIIPGGTPNPCQISVSDAKAASVQAKSVGSFSIINNRVLVISANCATLPPG